MTTACFLALKIGAVCSIREVILPPDGDSDSDDEEEEEASILKMGERSQHHHVMLVFAFHEALI